ncbi:MAG: avidin/streptavidin family protein [Mesorhizobium sp.]|jgi:Avidin family
MIRTILASGLILATASTALAFQAGEFVDFSSLTSASSTWQNQSGSTMMISIDSFGNVSGQYINRAAGTGCQGSPYLLAGRITGNFISFSVAWNNATENCNSVTGWAGYASVNGNKLEIITDWNLAYQGASSPMIEQGSDTFAYVPQVSTTTFKK